MNLIDFKLQEIISFLHKNNEKIIKSHKSEIYQYLKKLLQYYFIESKFTVSNGEHYLNCPWADEKCTCGPDTCSCVIFDVFDYDKITNLMNKYNI
jgi:mRNA-degrading endonuclease YafQ of YafQ-DinJ toxin-antitoxin module